MVAAFSRPALVFAKRTADALPVVLVLVSLAAVLLFIGWTYVAQPQHPDGVCYESRGRPTPCVLLEQHRAAKP